MKITVILEDLDLQGSLKDIKRNLINVSGKKLQQFLKKNSPKDSTKLSNSWKISNTTESSTRVSSDLDYALYTNDGTGVFGARGQPITPRTPNGVMVFQKGGKTIFTRRVQGQKGQKYVEKSIEELENILPRLIYNE